MEGLQWPVGMVTPNPALTLMAASMKAFRCSALPMWQGRPLAVMPRRRRLVSVSSTFCCFLGVGWGATPGIQIQNSPDTFVTGSGTNRYLKYNLICCTVLQFFMEII